MNIAYRDPGVGVFGLVNAVMPVGGDFLEVVQPVTGGCVGGPLSQAPRRRRRIHADLPGAKRSRTQKARFRRTGIRLIAKHETPQYTFTHFHPGDFDGVLTSIDTEGDGSSWQEPMGKWPPAGKDWKEHLSSPDTRGIVGATVQARDPEAAALRWANCFRQSAKAPCCTLTGRR